MDIMDIWSLYILCTAQVQVKGCIFSYEFLHEMEVSKNLAPVLHPTMILAQGTRG